MELVSVCKELSSFGRHIRFRLQLHSGGYDENLQGGAGGLSVGWVDLDLECSTILLGQ